MAPLFYALLVFLITLGPTRAVPAFASMAAGVPAGERRMLAFKSVAFATAMVLTAAGVGLALRSAWHAPWPALSIATGLIMLLAALRMAATTWIATPFGQQRALQAGLPPALSPLAAPLIVTPYGIAAVLLFTAADRGDARFRAEVICLLPLVMALNLVLMLKAKVALRSAGTPLFRAAGWILAPILAALAVQAVVAPVATLAKDYLGSSDDNADQVSCSPATMRS